MRKLYPICVAFALFFTFSLSAQAQEINWNTAPEKGLVFEISNKEAQKLLTSASHYAITDKLLHTLIDTFDIKTGWVDRPVKGHFILVRVVANKLHCEYTSVFPYQVFLLKEYDALALQVLDHDGNVREDARVKLTSRRIRIDPQTKTYRMENAWVSTNKRFVTVDLDGFQSVFNIQKHEVPTWNNDYYSSSDDGPDFYSYLITDKNKYKPNEKIRFKSYALSGSRMQLRKNLEVWLVGNRKSIRITEINPHRPGSYVGEFVLHDSLKLTLDQHYEIRLQEKRGRIVSTTHFKYEDYELTGNRLEVKLTAPKQYHPTSNQLILHATDVNGLTLKDAKAIISVRTMNIRETFQPLVILRDTLLNLEINLRSDSVTTISIPSDLFQKTNTTYQIHVAVLNSQNQRMESIVSAEHFYSQYELNTRFSNDSIIYEIFNNGLPLSKPTPMQLQRNHDVESTPIVLPYREKINPAISSVLLSGSLASRQIIMRNLLPKLEVTGGIEKDSFKIELINPQQLEVSWYVYQGSILLEKSWGKKMKHKSFITDRSQTYYVELLYSFGGQEQLKRTEYEFKEGFLNVSLDIPERVYPGQQVETTIQVTNQQGHPVSGVDLTAVATTAKLHYYLPDLPYYGSNSSPRSARAHYSKKDVDKQTAILNLDYKKWEKYFRLDTMRYYQFTYPKQFFKYTVTTTDSTQFAPFVMQQGMAKEIYVIEIKRKPVYYSWVDQPNTYSFYASPNQHHSISLRLHDRVLVIDSLLFEPGKKTILSFDLDHLPKHVQEIPFKYVTAKTSNKKYLLKYYAFTETERKRHLDYIATFKKADSFGYLLSGKEFTPLFNNQSATYKAQMLVGPITPGKQTFFGFQYTISYQHTGGYQYAFEDNIVYKLNADHLLPEKLENKSFNPMLHINEQVVTKEDFLKYKELPTKKWLTQVIDLAEQSLRIRVLLPEEKELSGIAAILFEECYTKKLLSPCNEYYPGYTLPRGCYNVIVVYNSGKYFKTDNVAIQSNTFVLINMKQNSWHKPDSFSQKLLTAPLFSNCFDYKSAPERTLTLYQARNTIGNVRGQLYDYDHTTISGASILVKGTNIGTMADGDGRFTLDISEPTATLVISFIGYQTKEIEVQVGSDITVYLTQDVMQLSEVVVVGYGSQMKQSLTGSISTVLAGRVAGVAIADEEIEVANQTPTKEEVQTAEQQLYQELMSLNSIRSNFHDVAIWEPRLFTDRHGQSKFSVTFPDDITRWDATVYAMNRQLQTGTARKSIRSYKPIMAELHVPQFLTKGDSAFFIGKVLNYSGDKNLHGNVTWSGARTDFERKIQFNDFYTTPLSVNPLTTDSVTTQFLFTRDDGYSDGEKRTISVVEQGTLRANGTLSVVGNQEPVTIQASAQETVKVKILKSQLDIYASEINDLINYKYACNEQLASKLLGLINHKILMAYDQKTFRYDKDVNKIIARLIKNQNEEFLWSWWDVSPNTSYWMSAHILRALKAARVAGYNVSLNIDNIVRKASYKFEFLHEYSIYDIDLIHALAGWGAKLNYAKHIHLMDSLVRAHEREVIPKTKRLRYPYSLLKEKFLLLETRQLTGMPYQRDSLLQYRKKSSTNEIYFADDKPTHYWYNNNLTANAIAYRIAKKDTALRALLTPMQLYFISLRKEQGWNTYHSSTLIADVLPDLIAGGATNHGGSIKLTGIKNETISAFPYSIDVKPNQQLTLQKESGLPMYYMKYVEERVTQAKTGGEGFRIKTFFANNETVLKAGEPAVLTVEVDVVNTSEQKYVMIDIPIPGSCSYADKSQSTNRIETHREYFKERTVIFCENMKPGKYSFAVQLLPRFTGSYLVNPAQVSLMYIPVVNANTDMKRVHVK